jgi:hypothetical protein
VTDLTTTRRNDQMDGSTDHDRDDRDEIVVIEPSEARRSFATSELYIYLIAVAALLFFTYESGGDSLSRQEGWQYATALTIGYLLSRGLAKAGSSEPRQRTRRF